MTEKLITIKDTDGNKIETVECATTKEAAEIVNKKGKPLTGANFAHVNLIKVNLGEAWLLNADLRWAKLIEANLKGANLIDAKVENTDFTGADVKNAKISISALYNKTIHLAKNVDTVNFLDKLVNETKNPFAKGKLATLFAKIAKRSEDRTQEHEPVPVSTILRLSGQAIASL